MKRIAIFNQNRNFFGTQLLQIPFLQFLAKAYPNAERIIYTSNPLSQVFSKMDLVDDVVDMNGYADVARRLKRYRPDLIFSFRRHSDLLNLIIGLHRKACTIGFAAATSRALLSHTVEKNVTRYRALHYLEFLEPLGVDIQGFHELFLCLAEPGIETKGPGEKWIFLMPGAGKPSKLWGLDNFFGLTDEIKARISGARFRFVLGPGEFDLKQQIEMQSNSSYTIDFNRPVPDLVGLLKQADLVIAHDCGPSHISHLCGAPQLGLFSDEAHDAAAVLAEWWLPRPNSRALVGKPSCPIASLAKSIVRNAALELLDGFAP